MCAASIYACVGALGLRQAPASTSKGQLIRVLYTHDGVANPIGVRSPVFEFQDKLQADGSWSDGRLEYRVSRKRKIKDRDCWQVEVASNLGRSQTLTIDAASGILVQAEHRVFMGRGDEFQLKLELQSQKALAAADFAKSQTAFGSLRQLQASLGRTGEQKVVEIESISTGAISMRKDGFMPSYSITAPSSEDVNNSTMPISQKVCPCVGMTVASGEYEVQPPWAAPPGMKKLTNITTPPPAKHWKLAMFTRGNAMSMAPICNGTT